VVLQVALGPWFNGIECLFESFALIVALLLTFYAYEVYKFSKIHEYKFFSLAFLCIAGSFFFKILTQVSFYNITVKEVFIGVATLALQNYERVYTGFLFSVFAWRALFLAGFLLYYALLDKARNRKQLFLSIYLAAVVALLSVFVPALSIIFYITAAIILAFIVHILYVNSKRKRTRFTKVVVVAFLLILAAQVSFIFVSLHNYIYLLGEVLQLAGFVLLLLNFYLLMRIKR
jgi:hypothetical protein